MSDDHLKEQLLVGLKQLDMNLRLLRETHRVRGLDIDAPFTKNTEDLLKLAYVNQSLKGLGL